MELSDPAEFESLVESVVASSEGSANGTELALGTAGPALELQPWWLEHLLEKVSHSAYPLHAPHALAFIAIWRDRAKTIKEDVKVSYFIRA